MPLQLHSVAHVQQDDGAQAARILWSQNEDDPDLMCWGRAEDALHPTAAEGEPQGEVVSWMFPVDKDSALGHVQAGQGCVADHQVGEWSIKPSAEY